jgi:hypothetical protein
MCYGMNCRYENSLGGCRKPGHVSCPDEEEEEQYEEENDKE